MSLPPPPPHTSKIKMRLLEIIGKHNLTTGFCYPTPCYGSCGYILTLLVDDWTVEFPNTVANVLIQKLKPWIRTIFSGSPWDDKSHGLAQTSAAFHQSKRRWRSIDLDPARDDRGQPHRPELHQRCPKGQILRVTDIGYLRRRFGKDKAIAVRRPPRH